MIGHLRAVPVLLHRVEIEGSIEQAVHKVLQTEVLIQREQLLFQLGETWNALLKWTIPADSRRSLVQVRMTTVEVAEEGDTQRILAETLQAMHEMNMLSTRLKVLCDRIIAHLVTPIIQNHETDIQIHTLSCKSLLQVVVQVKENPQKVAPVDMFPKLEQVLGFIHRPLKHIEVSEAKPDQTGTLATPVVKKLGCLLCKRLFDYMFSECLSQSIPKDNGNWEQFNAVVTATERFQDLLQSLNLLPPDQGSLMDYLNNVNALFANRRGEELLKRAHQIMMQDLRNSMEVCTEYPLGTQTASARSRVFVVTDDLMTFVMSCRAAMAPGALKIPMCQIRWEAFISS